MKIIVADDRKDNGKEIMEAVVDGCPDPELQPVFEGNLLALLDQLFQRVEAAVDKPADWSPGEDLLFDSADMVLLDNNLAHLNVRGARLTAESIAGYVRTFTKCPYVVSLNKNPYDFDLRYLVGDYQTHADLTLNTSHLANRALWTGRIADAKEGFLPSYWPRLQEAADKRRAQIAFVRGAYEQRIFETFGVPKSAYEYLSLHAKGALSSETEIDHVDASGAKTLDALTFADVFVDRGERSVSAFDDRKKLVAGARNPNVLDVLARAVAAHVDLWFRRDVLGPQEALVDLPHLIARLPIVLEAGRKSVDDWNRVLGAGEAPYGMDPTLHRAHLAPREFGLQAWVSRPAFWWSELKADETLSKMFAKAELGDWPDAVFCEDRSAFVPRSDHAITPFVAEFEGAWGQRYVARIPGVRYAPLSRFAV